MNFIKLMEHETHGRTHAYSFTECENLKALGWHEVIEPEVKKVVEQKRPGRPKRVK